MAFLGKSGKRISMDCSELLEELREDIAEFGPSEKVMVWCKKTDGVELYTNYDFKGTEKPIKMSELKKGEYFRTMTMGELLPLLEKENES